jgi:hypothetical protein
MSNNFGPNGVGYYAIARMLWDADADVRQIEEQFYRDAFGPAAEPMKRLYRRWEETKGKDATTPNALAVAYRDLDEASRLTKGQTAYHDRVDQLRMYAHFLKIYLQPKNSGGTEAEDVATWRKLYGEEEANRRICELGEWTSRLMDTGMTHSFAFNRYFIRRGNLAGCDTSKWSQPGEIPTATEIEAIFQQDMADLAGAIKALPEVQQPNAPREPEEGEELKDLVPFA